MIESILTKLGDVSFRYEEIESLLSKPDITSNQEEFIKLSKEYADLSPVVNAFNAFKKAEGDMNEAKVLMKDSDPEIKQMAEIEFEDLKQSIDDLENELKRLLLPKDPDDSKDVFRFASLQSEVGQKILEKHRVDNTIDSVVLIQNERVFVKSTAAFRILKELGGFKSILYGFKQAKSYQ